MPNASGRKGPRPSLVRRVIRSPGRPRKFGRSSRAVSITLPDDVIDRLESIDADLGRAIVSLIERAPRSVSAALVPNTPEISSYGTHAIIVVPQLRKLGKLAGVELVPIGHNRALISLDGAQRIPQFELAVRDALANDHMNATERRTLDAVADILRDARRSGLVEVSERTIIVLQSKRPRSSRGKASKP